MLEFAHFPYYFRDAWVEFKTIGYKIREWFAVQKEEAALEVSYWEILRFCRLLLHINFVVNSISILFTHVVIISRTFVHMFSVRYLKKENTN